MSVSPLAVAAMLACVRIGAVHTVVFAGFSSDALAGRIQDGEYTSLIIIIIIIPLMSAPHKIHSHQRDETHRSDCCYFHYDEFFGSLRKDEL